MEFKTPLDTVIAEKMLKFPLLGEELPDRWNLRLTREFDMTNDSHLFKAERATERLPLFEGKMIHQFECHSDATRYWVSEREARKALIGNKPDGKALLDYQNYRFAHRAIARSTDSRTMIGTVLPSSVFVGHSLNVSKGVIAGYFLLYVSALFNSLVFDFSLRQRVSANLTMFFIYQLPVPRLLETDSAFLPIVKRVAQLICTTPEFDALAKEVSVALKLPNAAVKGVIDAAARNKLRAEIDGLVAHLYGLTESEFSYILTTFPLVTQDMKAATLEAYRNLPHELSRS